MANKFKLAESGIHQKYLHQQWRTTEEEDIANRQRPQPRLGGGTHQRQQHRQYQSRYQRNKYQLQGNANTAKETLINFAKDEVVWHGSITNDRIT